MEDKTLQVLHIQMQAMTKLSEEWTQRMQNVTKLVGQLTTSKMEAPKMTSKWTFPENDYGTLVMLLTTDPWLKEKKRKWKSESWPAYAIRISMLVQWNVDARTLRYSFMRLSEA